MKNYGGFVFKYLPIKDLVVARGTCKKFNNILKGINVSKDFKLDEFCKFMTLRRNAEIPVPKSLDLSSSLVSNQEQGILNVIFQNYDYLKSFMGNSEITSWVKKSEGTVLWGLNDGSSYLKLAKREMRTSIFRILY